MTRFRIVFRNTIRYAEHFIMQSQLADAYLESYDRGLALLSTLVVHPRPMRPTNVALRVPPSSDIDRAGTNTG